VYRPGVNVGIGTDHTLFAKAHGKVEFRIKGEQQHTYVHVVAKQS
jgi:large subunit ribosomal protein L27